MNSKIKTIIISVIIVAILVLVYIFFVKDKINSGTLTTTFGINQTVNKENAEVSAEFDVDFLSLLLSIKSIKLNDAVFSSPAFISLRDSSIVLQGDGTEGRPNPFAPIGTDTNNTGNNSFITP